MTKVLQQKIVEVALSQIDEPKTIARFQIDPERIAELAASISAIGLQIPILLRPDGERYEIVAGHRRYLAHKQLELPVIKAMVRKMTDQEAAVFRATENLGRVDLSPLEEGSIYRELIDVHGMTVDQVASHVGKSTVVVMRRMDLLRMPPELQQAVHTGQISMTVAEELWSIRDATALKYYLSFAVENGCTREVARSWAKEWKDTQRRSQSVDVESGGVSSPYEPRPCYIGCDLCQGPVELGQDKVLRLCPECWATIKANM